MLFRSVLDNSNCNLSVTKDKKSDDLITNNGDTVNASDTTPITVDKNGVSRDSLASRPLPSPKTHDNTRLSIVSSFSNNSHHSNAGSSKKSFGRASLPPIAPMSVHHSATARLLLNQVNDCTIIILIILF